MDNRNRRTPAALFWSGGKDSSYALYKLLQDPHYEVLYLISTINGRYKRLSMHGVREEIIEAQAVSIGIPLRKFYVEQGTNEEYEREMKNTLTKLLNDGISIVAFGDIFLEDLRHYRERQLNALGMRALFPIWKLKTEDVVADFLNKGFLSYICCVDDAYFTREWAGKTIDNDFLRELPKTVDPCGENGEYHSLCVDGPVFTKKIEVKKGEVIYRPLPVAIKSSVETETRGYWYCDFTV